MDNPQRKNITLFPGFDQRVSEQGVRTAVGVRGASLSVRRSAGSVQGDLQDPLIALRTGLFGEVQDAFRKVIDYVYYLPDDRHLLADELDTYLKAMHSRGPGQNIRSAALREMEREGLGDLHNALRAAYQQRCALEEELRLVQARVERYGEDLDALKGGTFGTRFRKKRIEALEAALFEAELELIAIEDGIDRSMIALRIELDTAVRDAFEALHRAFDRLMVCKGIWDITSRIDGVGYGSPIEKEVERTQVYFTKKVHDLIETEYPPLHLENANGADIYLYPAFCVLRASETRYAVIDLRDVRMTYEEVDFFELSSHVPGDAEQLYTTWQYTTADGSPDWRFGDNREVPVLAYANLHLTSDSGLNELFMCSNRKSARAFYDAFTRYVALLRTHPGPR
jgi:hypothetical protein